MIYRQTAPQILAAIQNSRHPLLLSHEKPDGDTLGAGLALANYLDLINKNYKYFCLDKPAGYFSYLPKIEKIITDQNQIHADDHDLIILIDCAELNRIGLPAEFFTSKNRKTVINIDHHKTNSFYGDYNLVISDVSSTSEIIYNFFEYNGIEPDKEMATSLLTGILTDTTNFSNAGTTSESLKIAANLLNRGARINLITNSLSQNKSLAGLKLWGKILSTLEQNTKYNFAHAYITLEDIRQENFNKDELDGLANFLSLLQDTNFIVLISEEDENTLKGSLRTTKNEIDVAEIAAAFGGGGHQKAAGFKVLRKNIPEKSDWKNYILNAIINKLKAEVQSLKSEN